MPTDDQRFAALEAALDGPPTLRERLSSLATPWRRGLLALTLGSIPSLVFLTWRRVDWSVYPAPRLGAELLLIGALTLSLGWMALRPLHQPPLPGWVRGGLLLLALALLPLLALAPVAHQAHPASGGGTGSALIAAAAVCLGLGLAWALPGVLLGVLLDRGPGVSTLAFGAGGLSGVLSLQLHCPMVAPGHLLLGHGSVVALCGLLGLILAIRRPRRASM